MGRFIHSVVVLTAAIAATPVYAQDQRPLTGDHDVEPANPGKPGEITLYGEGGTYCHGERDTPKEKMSVPINACMSANFTLANNIHLSWPGSCPGERGRPPYLAFYTNADCTGEQAHPTWYDRGHRGWVGYCLGEALWGDVERPEGHFSMSLQCDGETPVKEMITTETMHLRLPQPKPKPTPKPKPRPTYASVTDSGCFIDELPGAQGFPRFLFQKPEADVCVNVEPYHKLTIYRNALCENGTEAMFARFNGKNCRGSPAELQEVTDEMTSNRTQNNCLYLSGEEANSYTFWCSGDLKTKQKLSNDLFESDDPNQIRIHYSNMPMEAAAGKFAGSAFAFLAAVGLGFGMALL